MVANGRAPGDMLGNFTCYNNRGASVVDYVICDKPFFEKIRKMEVLAPSFGSIHTPIEVSVNCTVSCTKMSDKAPLPPTPKLIWDFTKAEMLRTELSSEQNTDIYI